MTVVCASQQVNRIDLESVDVGLAAAPLRCSAWLDALAEHRAPEAATHFTLWCTAQTVVLGSLASGLANAVFLAAVVTDREGYSEPHVVEKKNRLRAAS